MNLEDYISSKFDEIIEFRTSLTTESDRGCALMAAAYLDSELEKLLNEFFVKNESIKKEMLGNSRPLGTFSSRIDISYLLGLIGPKARRDLHLIRKVRNDFGHVSKPLNFDDQAMKNRCGELYHDGFDYNVSPRQKFTRTALGVLAAIHAAAFRLKTIEEAADLAIDDATKERHRALLRIILGEKNDVT